MKYQMTVQDLISKLSKYPSDMPVMLISLDGKAHMEPSFEVMNLPGGPRLFVWLDLTETMKNLGHNTGLEELE